MAKEDMGSFWIRLINILYALGWIGIVIVSIITFMTTQPSEYLNEDKTTITCLPSNRTTSYTKVSKYIDKLPYNSTVGVYTIEEKAEFICNKTIEEYDLKYRQSTDNVLKYYGEKGEVYSDYDQKWYQNTEQNRKIIVSNIKKQYPQGIYKINEVNSTNGNWGNTTLWVIGVFVVLSLILDLLKSTLLYLIKGRSISARDFIILRLIS